MEIYLIRHGIAEEPSPGRPDDERALTAEGRDKLRRQADGLAAIHVRPDLLLTSPLRRARETAEIVAERLGVEVRVLAELAAGGAPAGVLGGLRPYRALAAIALVGHQPDLGRLASLLLSGSESVCPLPLKKGGVACVEAELASRRPRGELLWFATPKMLRALG